MASFNELTVCPKHRNGFHGFILFFDYDRVFVLGIINRAVTSAASSRYAFGVL